MRILRYIAILSACLSVIACRKAALPESEGGMTLSTEVLPFDGEISTKVSVDGSSFEIGDWIRVKIVCPYSTTAEIGESTYGGSFDAFYLLKNTGSGESAWDRLTDADKCDINGDYNYSYSPSLNGIREAQPTPYVYTASTWSEEKIFKTSNGRIIDQFCHVFHADQSTAAAYKASDLLWAQQYLQTGSLRVHLSFHHVMACLVFTIDDSGLPEVKKLDREGATPVLTLEGMPDIDQQEVVVGDYYALRSKVNSRFGYREKTVCDFEYNGKVLGIGVNVDNDKSSLDSERGRAYCYPMTGNPNPAYSGGGTFERTYTSEELVRNTGVYKAYKADAKTFRLIVPPCVLADNACIWLRDGADRYKMALEPKIFEEGRIYNVTVKLTDAQNE